MEREVLEELGMKSRGEALAFLKKLWCGKSADCPKCGAKLDYLHKKAKKSCCDWKCTGCGAIYKTIQLLDRLNEK